MDSVGWLQESVKPPDGKARRDYSNVEQFGGKKKYIRKLHQDVQMLNLHTRRLSLEKKKKLFQKSHEWYAIVSLLLFNQVVAGQVDSFLFLEFYEGGKSSLSAFVQQISDFCPFLKDDKLFVFLIQGYLLTIS